MPAEQAWHERASAAAAASAGRAPATPLYRHLRLATERRDGPLDAFRSARRTFIAGGKVDMGRLAAELGVDRATLFRWVGNRDQLLSEIIWSVCLPTWQAALDAATGTGGPRVVGVFGRFAQGVVASAFFRTYLERERDRALRLLTTRAGIHQARVTALFEGLLAAERECSDLRLPLPVHDTAYVMTRVAESFVYADLIVGEIPDAAKAATVVAAILGVPPDGIRLPPHRTADAQEEP